MIFVNENNKTVILSARKCGLMSLMSTVPSMPNRHGHIYPLRVVYNKFPHGETASAINIKQMSKIKLKRKIIEQNI